MRSKIYEGRSLPVRLLALGSLMMMLLLSACGGVRADGSQATATPPASQIDWKQVDQAMGKPGTQLPGGVYKFSFPRTDLQVTLGGVVLKAGFALGSHVEFLPMGQQAMMMGDLVLTEDEVNGVMVKLQQEGIEQTALHNHLLGETPRVMYMHIGGQGDPVQLARSIHSALVLTKTPFTAPSTTGQPQPLDLDTKQLDSILHANGKATGGIYQYSIARAETITADGTTIPPAMGVATALNFQPTGNGKAAITGDFVLPAKEVNPVIRILEENGIEVTAVHNHMLTEAPRLFYLHFWANDDALKLAHGLRAALDKTNSAPATPQH